MKIDYFFIELIFDNVHYQYVVGPRKLRARRELNSHDFSVQYQNKI